MFFSNKDMAYRVETEKFTQKVLARGGNIMLTEAVFTRGGKAPSHKHPHQQIAYIAKGRVKFRIEDSEWICKEGDSLYVPPETEHEVEALEDNSVVVDIFSPQREDFVE